MLEEWSAIAAKSKFSIMFVAVGGTALALLKKVGAKAEGGISFRTKDGARLDIFGDGQTFSTTLPEDFFEHLTLIKDFGSIKLYALSIYDIIITKLARNSVSDEEDWGRAE